MKQDKLHQWTPPGWYHLHTPLALSKDMDMRPLKIIVETETHCYTFEGKGSCIISVGNFWKVHSEGEGTVSFDAKDRATE